MTLDLGLRRFSLLPLFAQLGGDEPPPSGMKRQIHWVGKKESVEQDQEPVQKGGGESPKKKETQGYRELSSISAEAGNILGFHQERQNGISEYRTNSGNYFLGG